MKKSKKIILRSIPVLIMLMVLFANFGGIFGASTSSKGGVSTDYPSTASGVSEISAITTLAGSLWKTVLTIAQVVAFIAIIFAGIRYMFASADTKADIKKQTIILVVGAIFVFGASTIVSILMSIVNQVSSGIT